MTFSKSILMLSLLFGFSAFAKKTPMTGVQVICTVADDFFVFNLKQNRMWIDRGPFQNNALGEEVYDLTMNSVNGHGIGYKGLLNWNVRKNQAAALTVEGMLYLNKIPMQNIVRIVGEPPAGMKMQCRKN